MRHPEMSHSPAYYHGHDHRVTAYLHDSVPETHLSPEPPPLLPDRVRQQGHDTRKPEPNSAGTSISSPYPSDSWDTSSSRHTRQHSQHSHNHSHRQTPMESIYPASELPAVAPMTGAVRKDERVRGSWTDHSSYMSDNHHLAATRIQKRAIHNEEPLVEDGQDALVMLFRLSIPVPIFSFCASLYTIFGLLFVILVLPLRIGSCIPYFRATSFRAQLCHLLVPQLHIHERLVGLRRPSSLRSSPTQSICNDQDESSLTDACEHYSIFGLIAVLLLSSLLSVAFLLLALTAGFFWVFAMIMGNPDGTERKDDGRAAVLGVCKWWQIWLSKARKPPR
ncbi:hypothetical protein BDV25DRAFT_165879 [Aspergillus avenaceus]|uniref:Uncharacterized protein n=1 Tax=Aspergillus avenaceus TaxID=36643 RepID=A0A5N6TET2_ASPAV|nr:hypothetical protein BDV25DRAFT_165879 [Aspergillus avenaceus]